MGGALGIIGSLVSLGGTLTGNEDVSNIGGSVSNVGSAVQALNQGDFSGAADIIRQQIGGDKEGEGTEKTQEEGLGQIDMNPQVLNAIASALMSGQFPQIQTLLAGPMGGNIGAPVPPQMLGGAQGQPQTPGPQGPPVPQPVFPPGMFQPPNQIGGR